MEKLHLVHPPPSNNRYTPIRHLGTGGNGSVHLYRDAKKGTLVAVKTIRHEDSISPPNEAHILQPLGPHTNIVQYHTTLPHPSHEDRINLVFEFCPLGDLSAYIQATKTPIPESFAWHVFAHLTHGLHYLHTHGILHGDLKPANILLCPADASSSYPVLKLADFGAATLNPPHNVPRGHMATRGYQPPESEFRNGTQCDVWALGCVVYQLITRRLPLDVFAQPDVEPEVWFELSVTNRPKLNTTMPKQKNVASGRVTARPRKGRHAGSTAARGGRDVSPAPAPVTGGMKLKINLARQADPVEQQPIAIHAPTIEDVVKSRNAPDEDDIQEGVPSADEEEEFPGPETRRSGRVVKKRQDDDFAWGSDISNNIELSSVGKVDDDKDEAKYQDLRSDPPLPPTPTILSTQQRPRKPRGRPRKNAKSAPLTPVKEHPSSETLPESSPSPSPPTSSFTFAPSDRIYEIMGVITSQSSTQIALPTLYTPSSPSEKPWTTETLTQLYITAYNSSQWHVCDLVADTWIRAFHAVRHRAEKSGAEEMHLWRLNDALMRRRCAGREGFNPNERNHTDVLRVVDPLLCSHAHDFNSEALTQLYQHTHQGAGARLLWADSMALCGTKLEQAMARGKKYGQTWHADLMYDILCSTLRMVGRKLTLKIEEGGEGAWCKRYHEHGKNGLPCYRSLAADEGVGSGYGPVGGVGVGMKRGREEGEGEGESDEDGGERKRARLGDEGQNEVENREVVDKDAEGESDSE
ncbi:hypothetical protein CC86DRAFT_465744 [Ophiobolus disseminans]|uniref:Protein kinase domain-containing protein n=1 Tax=Ophiobolus disseminans TaxID=1469910 RepID=A0A6A7A3N5_9PLEO|nr:hypothetical protein CC86DRAFT_465744 [Ophiobolus disseminans]